ncbi:NAD(P)H-hydrate dehydratase [Pyrofollis japonicus]|uniref:NAD(P)H-hydrate dehydratase n=1 Tax=Pyrofollis japonicus TaxID=3060460 RepID=UPI00295B6522|nr:NAD(P)H-hydrate dehydratase [Pyrofollis japonicus]
MPIDNELVPVIGLGETISSIDVRVIDTNSEWLGVSRLQLMENAGRSVADTVAAQVKRPSRIVVFAGPGGNGGDGIAAARHLAYMGHRVDIILVSKPDEIKSEEARIMYNIVRRMDLSISIKVVRGCKVEPVKADAIIDALLGVGVRGAPRSPYKEAIDAINSSEGLKVAVDTPSGLDPDTGDTPGVFVKADITVTFHKPKPGLLKRRDATGRLVIADIGVPPEAEIYVGPGDVEFRVPRRKWNYHKGMAGRVLIVGGSMDFVGAPILAALAAERSGVDLVYLAAPSNVIQAVSSRFTIIPIELRGHPWLHPDHLEILERYIERVDAIAIGMGMGLYDESREAFIKLLEKLRFLGKPVVVDADGLKHLTEARHLLGENVVVTPHEAEFARLFNVRPEPVEKISSRIRTVAAAARKYGTTVLLKGPVDVISNGNMVRLNKTGAPAMSVGGTGDSLAGITAAMLAKGLDTFNAACVAAFINGVAGALAYNEKRDSMNTLDLIGKIPLVLGDPLEAARKAMIYERVPYEERLEVLIGAPR